MIELLKEEVNRLKGHKNKPKIKPSKLEGGKNKPGTGRNSSSNLNMKVLAKEEITIKALDIPEGSIFKGYQIYKIQELIIEAKAVHYRLERWRSLDGKYIIAKLPEEIKGCHFGPVLRSYLEHQNLLGVTEPQILEQLRSFGIKISTGQGNRMILV